MGSRTDWTKYNCRLLPCLHLLVWVICCIAGLAIPSIACSSTSSLSNKIAASGPSTGPSISMYLRLNLGVTPEIDQHKQAGQVEHWCRAKQPFFFLPGSTHTVTSVINLTLWSSLQHTYTSTLFFIEDTKRLSSASGSCLPRKGCTSSTIFLTFQLRIQKNFYSHISDGREAKQDCKAGHGPWGSPKGQNLL